MPVSVCQGEADPFSFIQSQYHTRGTFNEGSSSFNYVSNPDNGICFVMCTNIGTLNA